MKVNLRKIEIFATFKPLKNRRLDWKKQPGGSQSQQVNKITDAAGRV